MRISMQEMGEQLKQRRQLLGLRQDQLAQLAGVSARTIQLVEQGKNNPSLETLLQLADPLGLRLDLVLKEPGKTTEP